MCGIACILGKRDDPPREMARMLDTLRHRGPDGEGDYHDALVSLGHCRLSIIDLKGGRQPLHDGRNRIHLVCNGEIYNYRELRVDLERRGYPFLTNSDCELLIALYETYGDQLLEHVRGMFAFVLWDSERQRLLAARDHLGQKPLFYLHERERLAIASEIKALLALDPSARELDLQALDQYFALRLIAPPLTMFKRIRKLPPGHMMVVEHGREPRISRYWRLRFTPKRTGSENELIDELEARIGESLRLHLVSDVPVGAFLSGGLDSSLLVAMLARQQGVKNLPTFTMGLPYERFDEAPHARIVARTYGTDHHERTITPSLMKLLPELVWHLDEPSDPLSLCTYQVARLAREHVKVVIGGDGGDELFGGYDRYYGNLYADHYSRLPVTLRRKVLGPALSFMPQARWYKSLTHQLRWLHTISFAEGGARYAASLSYFYFDREARTRLFSPDARALLRDAHAEAPLQDAFEAGDGEPIDRMLYADSCVRLPDHPVMITDRMTMAQGLEARSPFMDHRLAEFAASLPVNLKIRGRSLRYIQRKLAARYLPREIIERPKQGFSSALPYILRHEYRQLSQQFLTHAELVRSGLLNEEAVSTLMQEHLLGRADHGNRLWLLINAEVWYRMAILQQSREQLRHELSNGPQANAA
jgi:asparagine synthase (glutamine-hydrolysing)